MYQADDVVAEDTNEHHPSPERSVDASPHVRLGREPRS
jgi:hypothetical protein